MSIISLPHEKQPEKKNVEFAELFLSHDQSSLETSPIGARNEMKSLLSTRWCWCEQSWEWSNQLKDADSMFRCIVLHCFQSLKTCCESRIKRELYDTVEEFPWNYLRWYFSQKLKIAKNIFLRISRMSPRVLLMKILLVVLSPSINKNWIKRGIMP